MAVSLISLMVATVGEYVRSIKWNLLYEGDIRHLDNCSYDFESTWEHAAQRLLIFCTKMHSYTGLLENIEKYLPDMMKLHRDMWLCSPKACKKCNCR